MIETDNFEDLIEAYIKTSDFDKLLFISKCKSNANAKEEDVEYNQLIASFVACIEGNIEIDFKNKLLCFWLGEYNVNLRIDDRNSNKYFFEIISNLVKLDRDFYSYIKKYFNLWHQNNDSEFTYDKYHRKELANNLKNLLYLLNDDLEKLNKSNDINKYNEISNIVHSIIKVIKVA